MGFVLLLFLSFGNIEIMYKDKNREQILNKLKLEAKRKISSKDMQRLYNKFLFWKKMHPEEFNCPHCIFNHYPCDPANKHYYIGAPGIEDRWWEFAGEDAKVWCLAFLQKGNYVK